MSCDCVTMRSANFWEVGKVGDGAVVVSSVEISSSIARHDERRLLRSSLASSRRVVAGRPLLSRRERSRAGYSLMFAALQ